MFIKDLGGFLLGIFVLLIFGAKVSGSHYNPAVTLAFMFRKDTGRFSRPLGLAYMIAQVAGGFLGGLLGWIFTQGPVTFGIEDPTDVGFAITAEIIGSFFLAFLYLTQTESETKLKADPAITLLIIAASYIAAMLMVSGSADYLSCLNPAVAIGASFEQVYAGHADGWKRAYVYLPVPFAGGFLAVLFHEMVYKKVRSTISASEENDSNNDEDDNKQGMLDHEGDRKINDD